MNIVFNINPLGLEGLGVTLSSLTRNCSNTKELKLWFLCYNILQKDKINIIKLLKFEGYKGDIDFIDFDANALFGNLNALHGDWTPYGRLLIGKNIPSDSALYLDADLIILIDILELKDYDFKGALLAAVYGAEIDLVLDKKFFINILKWPSNRAYFNSGVVLFNLKRWRKEGIDVVWQSLALEYPKDLISHDQTLLNAVCGGEFAYLPIKYNNQWLPGSSAPENMENSIIHLVGSPKPWDLFGKHVHKSYNIWNTYNSKFWSSQYNKVNSSKLKRTWYIKKSIIRHLSNLIMKDKE